MRLLAVPLLTLSFAGAVSAADYGIGLSIQDEGQSIYLPIDITDKFRIEPVVHYYEFMHKSSQVKYKSKEINVLLGLFGKENISNNVSTYYGGRLGYSYTDHTFTAGSDSSKQEMDGYIIEPAFGF